MPSDEVVEPVRPNAMFIVAVVTLLQVLADAQDTLNCDLTSLRTNAVGAAAFAGAATKTLPATSIPLRAAVKFSPIRMTMSLHRDHRRPADHSWMPAYGHSNSHHQAAQVPKSRVNPRRLSSAAACYAGLDTGLPQDSAHFSALGFVGLKKNIRKMK